jgi:hypothetical protein
MPTPASIQELRTAIGFNKAVDLVTPLLAPSLWALRQTSRGVLTPQVGWEDDAAELGKGDSWASERFPTGLDLNFPWEGYLTSENASMLAAFGLGKVASVAAGTGWTHTCTPVVQSVDGIDMPSTTLVQAIRQGAGVVTDYAFPGVCLEEFSISLKTGLGRQNATMRSTWVGTGQYVKPSGIIIPALYREHSMNAMSASTITIQAQDYKTTHKFISLDMGWKNNIRLDSGYFPGSGTQVVTEGAPVFGIRGRMRRGDPTATLSYSAEFVNGSTELDILLAGTEGTAQVTLAGAVIGAGPNTHKVDLQWARVGFQAVPISDTDGIVTCAVQCTVMKDYTLSKILTMAVTNEQETVGALAT